MDKRQFEDILLGKEQQELLAALVEAARNVPPNQREKVTTYPDGWDAQFRPPLKRQAQIPKP